MDKDQCKVDTLVAKLLNDYPELEVKNATVVDHGWNHDILDIDDEYIFRFVSDDSVLGKLQDELKILAQVKSRCSIDIPNYIFVADDFSFGGYKKIKGSFLTAELFSTFNEKQVKSAAIQIAELLTALHEIKKSDLTESGVKIENRDEESEWLSENVNNLLKSALTDNQICDINKAIERFSSTTYPTRTLIHGDLYSANIIWNKENQSIGVIDFTDAVIGDPASDFSELYEYSSDFVDMVYSYYRGPKDNHFLDRSKLYYKKVGVYLMIQSFLTDHIDFNDAKAIFDISVDL